MHEKTNIEERCRKILENNGGLIADKARTILLEDPALKDLRQPLEFVSKNWRDLTPALMRLSCEAVRGRADETNDVAIAMSLMNLSFYIWDDIIDNARFRSFRSTLYGKFGEGTALVIGGLSSAKAFSILNKLPMDKEKHQKINKLIWELWTKMTQAETVVLRLQGKENSPARKKFWKIKMEAADLETWLKIGAIIGGGSENEIKHLGKYGLCLGIVLELIKDFRISINLTAELGGKISNGKLPYSILWASQRSKSIRTNLDLAYKKPIEQTYIKKIVQDMLTTKVLDHIAKNIKRYSKKAKDELSLLKINNATQTLHCIIDAQPRLFSESLSMFQTQES